MIDTNKIEIFPNYRLTALDLTRLLAMLLMIQGHTLDALATPTELDVSIFPWSLWSFMRGFTAQIFLIVSGMVQVFANRRQEDGSLSGNLIFRRVRMGVILIIIGYMFLFPADRIANLHYLDKKAWMPFLQINILQLIGISLLTIISLFTFIRNDKTLGFTSLGIALAITFFAPFNSAFPWFSYLPEGFASYFSFEHGSIFPIFPYTAFMLYGVAFGCYLKSKKPELRTDYIKYWSTPFGIVIIFVGLLLFEVFRNIGIPPELALKVNPGIIFFQVGVVLLVMALAAFIYSKSTKLAPYYAILGKKALFIYIAHLLLIYGLPWFPGLAKTHFRQFTLFHSALIALALILTCMVIAYAYEWTARKYPILRKVYIYGFISAIIVFIFLGNMISHIF